VPSHPPCPHTWLEHDFKSPYIFTTSFTTRIHGKQHETMQRFTRALASYIGIAFTGPPKSWKHIPNIMGDQVCTRIPNKYVCSYRCGIVCSKGFCDVREGLRVAMDSIINHVLKGSVPCSYLLAVQAKGSLCQRSRRESAQLPLCKSHPSSLVVLRGLADDAQ
jgi:hypothetical protein